METIVLGGTAQVDDYSEDASVEDSKFIRTGCLNLDPSITNSKLIKEWVGLRPGRDTVRVEKENFRKR